jgi:NADP-dependent 3-hydroxy acid dehydrogenase YdfG
MKTRTALITGATSGIGKATAELFAENGINLIACGRRVERLQELKNELGKKVAVHTLSFDVCDKAAVFSAIESLPESFSEIDILINNAGNAHGLSPVEEGAIEDWDAMIDGNVKGLLYVTKSVLPSMTKKKSGHIVNIGSIAAKEVYPKGNVYCASKHAVDALSKGMLLDLVPYGIKVTSINPGLVSTEFSKVRFKGDESRADNVYRDMMPLTGKDIAEVILYTVTLPKHVNISDLTVLPTAQASAAVVYRG